MRTITSLFLILGFSACTITGSAESSSGSNNNETEDTDSNGGPTRTEDDTDEVADTDKVESEDTDDTENDDVDTAEIDETDDTEDIADELDEDGDGFRAGLGRGEDCNDDNDDIHPDAAEVPGDGVDQDCDDRDCPDGEDLCFLDEDDDGHIDAIVWSDDAWDDQVFSGDDAEVLENGAGTGCRLTGRELTSNGLSYILSFERVGECTTALTLKTDSGREWWQNAGFCSTRFRADDPDSWCYESDGPGSWMVGVRWDGEELTPFDP